MKKQKEPDKLSLDAMEARKAGMSYGMWKGLQKPKPIEKKIPEGWKICEYCGKPFKPTTGRPQKYCEANCTNKAFHERQKARQMGVFL
jgi:hypothetical protein